VTTDGIAGRHGATVSSFCSGSADPPSLLVCLRADSRIARAVAGNGEFCVNVLDHSAEALAERFAGRGTPDLIDRFEGLDVNRSAGRPAVLAAAAAAFCCRLVDRVPSGSHLVLIGAVTDVTAGSGRPLTYLHGDYATVSRRSTIPSR
jgi:flavin reductase (DIM6/NTAB) family NADH-FMN oxidoreductase RutF